MTLQDLEKFANEFLEKEFNMSLDIPITLNGRLTRAMGRFLVMRNRRTNEARAIGIELNKTLYEHNSMDVVLDTLKHELVHYALFSKGLPYSDGDYVFESTLKRLGVTATMTTTFQGKAHVYECDCGKEFIKRGRRLAYNRGFRCGCGNIVTKYDWKKETII